MTPAEIDRVFGRGRLRMTTGEHVEVFREEARDGEERRYTKRFLETASGDFRAWTEREWRILDRLGARGDAAVAKVVRYFPVDDSGMARLQTRDAGPTVDQWAALVPLRRTAPVLPHVFGDCANWWALARQCLIALDPLHALGFVHLDLKPDNVCIATRPAYAGRPAAGEPLAPDFEGLALIDVAFSLLPEIELPAALPLARDPGYEYQSPRLLDALDDGRRGKLLPTQTLDWRCDLFSLAAMLWRYLPELDEAAGTGWTSQRHASATQFVTQLLDIHTAPLPAARPHRSLIGEAALRLTDPQLTASLQTGSSFDPDRAWRRGAESVPLTRVVATSAVPPPTAARREPSFAAPAPAPAASAAPAAAAPVASPTPPPVAAVPPPAAAAVPPRAATQGAPPAAARVAPVATSVATPTAVPAPTPAAPSPVPRVAASVVSAVAASVEAPAVAQAATRPAPSLARANATTASPSAAKDAGADATRREPPFIARDTTRRPAMPPPSTPTSTVASPTAAATATRPTGPLDARSEPPPRATTPWPERPRAPARTPLPILAAAGIAALLVALAAWWGLDGRATFERMAQRRGAPAAADVAIARPAPAAAAEPAAADTTTTFAAPPATPDASAARIAIAPEAPASMPAVAVANDRTAANPVDANPPRSEAPSPAAGELEAAAAAWLNSRMPRVAQAAERQLAPVLRSGARSTELRRRGDVRVAMQAARSSPGAAAADVPADPREARVLNEAALVAYWRDNSLADAVRLQTQAFGANPSDAEIAGNLAFLLLKEKPPQAEEARQLALHALTLKDDRFPSGRIEDWTTLAIADALTGREADARNAWFVSMALASDLQRQCNAAMRAQATYGERLRPSVQAMLQRARSSAAYGRCEVPQTAQQAATQEAAAPQPSAQRKPARKQVKSKSTQKGRRAIP